MLLLGALLTLAACSSSGDESGTPTSADAPGDRVALRADVHELALTADADDPDDVDLPDPDELQDAEPGEGEEPTDTVEPASSEEVARLVELLEVTALLASGEASLGDCEATARSASELGTPEELLAVASALSDDVSSELATSFVASAARAMAACGSDDSAAMESTVALAWQWALWDRRATELGF